MSKSEKFEDVLDECLERLLVKNEPVEQCLESFPEHSDKLKPLLETALAARQMTAIQPRPEFRNQARVQFYRALQEMERKKSHPLFSWSWQPRWASAVAIVLAISLVSSGTVAAASGSMPDNPLYTVKRATEQVQLAFTFSELGKAELHTKLADKRVTEIVYLADKGKPEKIALIAGRLNTHLSEISVLVAAPGTVSRLAVAPAVERAAVPEEVSAPKQATTAEEASALKEKRAGKEAPLADEGKKKGKEKGSKVDRRAKLKTTVESQANNNIARLRTLLETAPESARPALQRAIELSEIEYEKAIEALK